MIVDSYEQFNMNIINRIKTSLSQFKTDLLAIKLACLADKSILFESNEIKIITKI